MTTSYPQLVLFGDSLFQFAQDTLDGFSFQAALQQHCARRVDVINRGLSGYNTSNALAILPQVFQPPAPGVPKIDYLLVWFGANDASIPLPENNQHVPLDEFKTNLARIILDPRISAHKPKILLVTPPPLDEIQVTKLDLAKEHPTACRKAKISATYAEAVRHVAADHANVVLIDFWSELMSIATAKTPGFDAGCGAMLGDLEGGTRGYLEHLLPDGLHLSGEAYSALLRLVVPHIHPEWSAQQDEPTDYVYPEWRVAPWNKG